jgi:hypothetical protein
VSRPRVSESRVTRPRRSSACVRWERARFRGVRNAERTRFEGDSDAGGVRRGRRRGPSLYCDDDGVRRRARAPLRLKGGCFDQCVAGIEGVHFGRCHVSPGVGLGLGRTLFKLTQERAPVVAHFNKERTSDLLSAESAFLLLGLSCGPAATQARTQSESDSGSCELGDAVRVGLGAS